MKEMLQGALKRFILLITVLAFIALLFFKLWFFAIAHLCIVIAISACIGSSKSSRYEDNLYK